MVRMPTAACRMLSIAACLALAACGHEPREPDPYAARLAKVQPPFVRLVGSVIAAAVVRDSVTNPEFTHAQAVAGADVYKSVCARCHAAAQWTGDTFAAGWQDRRLSSFYDLVVTTMPQDAPGSLSAEQYVNVTAYVLELAGFRSGAVALSPDTAMLRHARLAIKPTPAS